MTNRSELIGAVDFGARAIRVVIGRMEADGTLRVLGHGAAEERGCVSQGVIQDLSAAQRAFGHALRQAEKEARGAATGLFCGVQGRNVETHIREAAVSIEDGVVTEAEIEAVRDKAVKDLEDANARLLSAITSEEWYVNDLRVRNPIGLRGHHLKTRIHVALLPTVIEENLVACIDSFKREVEDVVFVPMAAALGVMEPEDMELGVAVIDLGCRNTGLAVYRDYRIMGTHCFEWGGYHITRDVAAGLHVGFDEADDLILEYGVSDEQLAEFVETEAKVRSVLDEKNRPARIKLKTAVPEAPDIVDREDLESIVAQRSAEMLEQVRKHLAAKGLLKHLVRGVILTGGGGTIKNMPQLAETIFQAPCRRGLPTGMDIVPHAVRHAEFAPAVGILRHGFEYRRAALGYRNAGAMGALKVIFSGGLKKYFD